jgi:hypothetical protein
VNPEGIQIRHERRQHFAQLPHEIVRNPAISDKAIRLRAVLESYVNWQDRTCYPSIGTISTDMGCSSASVKRAIQELVDRDLLRVQSGKETGSSNVYVLRDPPVENPPGWVTHDLGGSSPVTHRGSSPMSYKQEPLELEPINKSPTKGRTDHSRQQSQFDEWYAAFPRHEKKEPADRIFRRRMKEGVSFDEIMQATRNYVTYCNENPDAFRFLPASFLGRDKNWLDWIDGIPEGRQHKAKPGFIIPNEPQRHKTVQRWNIVWERSILNGDSYVMVEEGTFTELTYGQERDERQKFEERCAETDRRVWNTEPVQVPVIE